MRGLLASFVTLGLCAPGVLGGEMSGKAVLEFWDAAYLRGNRAGHVHTVTERFERKGQPILRATVELRLKVRRFNDVVDLGMDTGTWEAPDGRVLGTFMRQYLGKAKRLEIIGIVQGDQLVLE